MSEESERSIQLATLTTNPSPACRSAFDTTSLALGDMEQANIAYGRYYVRLELPADAFLPRPDPMPPAPPPEPEPPPATQRRSQFNALMAPPVAGHLGMFMSGALQDQQAQYAEQPAAIEDEDRQDEHPPTGATYRHGPGFIPRDPSDRPADLPNLLDPRNYGAPDARPEVQDAMAYLPKYRTSTMGFPTLIGWQVAPPVNEPPPPPPVVPPALYLVQRHRLVSYARGFGLGPHLYSFTLLPDEEVEIEIKTWKSQEQIDKTGSSIFDGQSQAAESEFQEAVERETSQTQKRDKAFEAHVETSGEVSWGFGSASVTAGASYNSASSSEQFAKDMSSATQKVANKANRERRVEMTQSSEVKTTEGEEERTRRKVKNINKCNTLNFHYFQLVRKYESRLELHDLRLRYASGVPLFDDAANAWRYDAEEVPIAQMGRLLARVLTPAGSADVRRVLFAMLGPGSDDDPGLDVLTDRSTPDRMRLDLVPLQEQISWEDAVRAAARDGVQPPTRPVARLPRLLSRDERVIATNAIYADAMMGQCSACDDFIRDSRVLDVEARQLENRERALAVDAVRLKNRAFEVDPVPRRAIHFEGVPAGATIHLREGEIRRAEDDDSGDAVP